MKADMYIRCPHCEADQLLLEIPYVDFIGNGKIYECEHCHKFFRVGMVTEARVTPLGGE